MKSCGVDFLGLVHDLRFAISDECVTFWPRESLVTKMRTYLQDRRSEGLTSPGMASKILGLQTFASLGQFGMTGRAGARALLQRIHYDSEPWHNSGLLLAAFDLYDKLLDFNAVRVVELAPPELPALVLATDAQADSTCPSGGFLLFDPLDGFKTVFFASWR